LYQQTETIVMKFKKLKSGINAEWKAETSKGTYFINKMETSFVSYEVSVDLNDGSYKILKSHGYITSYLRDCKDIAEKHFKGLK